MGCLPGHSEAANPSRREVPMSKAPAPTIVWLRQDLRLADNPALHAARQRGGPVVPLFIWAPDEEGAWPPGGASAGGCIIR